MGATSTAAPTRLTEIKMQAAGRIATTLTPRLAARHVMMQRSRPKTPMAEHIATLAASKLATQSARRPLRLVRRLE
jgi:hypothetical protein